MWLLTANFFFFLVERRGAMQNDCQYFQHISNNNKTWLKYHQQRCLHFRYIFISLLRIITSVNLFNTALIHQNFRRCYSYLADLVLPIPRIKIWGCFVTNSLLHLRILLIKHNVVLDIMTVATAELTCQINPNMAPTGT